MMVGLLVLVVGCPNFSGAGPKLPAEGSAGARHRDRGRATACHLQEAIRTVAMLSSTVARFTKTDEVTGEVTTDRNRLPDWNETQVRRLKSECRTVEGAVERSAL